MRTGTQSSLPRLTERRTIKATTLEQQSRIREQLRVPGFKGVVPYVTVMTAEGRPSPI